MKFSDLTKEQKQYLFLALGGLIFLVVLLNNFVIAPLSLKNAQAEETISKLESEVRLGESILRRDPVIREEMQETAEKILDLKEANLPPDVGRYIWARLQISEVAFPFGIRARVREHGSQRYVLQSQDYENSKTTSTFWIPYAVNVDFEAGYQTLIDFIAKLYEVNPYVNVASVSVERSRNDEKLHQIRLILEWPILRHPEDQAFLENKRSPE